MRIHIDLASTKELQPVSASSIDAIELTMAELDAVAGAGSKPGASPGAGTDQQPHPPN